MNGTGNERDISAEFVPMRKALLVRRNREGAETARGYLLSNLIEQTLWLNDPDERPWATHPMQTAKGMMQWQMDRLTELGPRRNITELSLERLREVLSYDPETGYLTWLKRLSPICKLDGPAGVLKKRGYRKISIDGRDYTASQLAWFLHHGAPAPTGYVVDHKNLDKDDNRIENLRLATYSQNMTNQARNSRNTTGLKGAARSNRLDRKTKFTATIRVNGKRIFLGSFMTAEEAHEAYCRAAEKYHGEFARTE